ncbi:E3 ubiquitin-protein ligase RNF169 isoform X1 [Siniperca chuatsi]|uniref:E3 ubiquitin-protein ligase RNF169 isoform X1 n=1 Tax=Siniperca chuatsi TaxID=119488 RepID=UPI001CE14A38|nr:E3 ubiquitin-protein ligase RNF169 isoform X1 [Siniperca chuatsi]XP_044057659.1 E3 ubiquitin-protein ligase RNF169 isoform X1 [Siniperca chuatsi]XP_044057660.1 E3 ubiquitin-protein ligase RNF169 isoform X1 [Siniperca chuatsi]XP_044057661.1 E3 ubiquitin-protein ligase RNF169 isoform X1 [Siniperca chuatsi]XP_044057662.1 E3 ubiquitin-protein ligase RNF169 isoform X1 [Siniperca chuatsi]XP_044057663.1 E3 ubiquitin-protein ligase RNF169 isoform X1 [Siniperca chuatsi]XP_044057664.1 E3 ubiquitin-p
MWAGPRGPPRLRAGRAGFGGRAGFVLRADRREKTHQGRWRPQGPPNGLVDRPAPPAAGTGPGPELGAAPGPARRKKRRRSARRARRGSPAAARPADTRPARSASPTDTPAAKSGSAGGATPRGAAAGPAGGTATAGEVEFFVSPALVPKCSDASSGATGKHKLLPSEDREEAKRRNALTCKDESVRRAEEPGVLSDSENEEPISRRIRNISAFIRKTKNCAAFAGGSQRSQSCTDSVEDRGGKPKVAAQPALMDRVGISHSYTAGILLSSENSRSVSAPITAPDRRLTWRAVVSSSSTPLGLAPPRPERSISPESNDSISEELNHFKPIVCSPCTPPKRLPDGRLMEPTIVKSTPRNLTRGLQKATSYEASPAVLQKWRQIELDRQSLKVNSKATLTSPVNELHNKTGVGDDGGGGAAAAKTHRDGDGVVAVNKRRLLFDPPAADTDAFQKQSVKIRVPAIRYSSEAAFRGSSDFESTVGTPESCSGGALFSRKQSFSPYTKNSGFQSCKLVPKDSQSPKKESDSSLHNQSTSRRGKKREQKTKHLDSDRDSDLKRSRSVSQEAFDERYIRQIQQERRDRALALKLQRQFDLENQTVNRRRSPDAYFLRSWMSNQNRRRRGLRRSRRINKKH